MSKGRSKNKVLASLMAKVNRTSKERNIELGLNVTSESANNNNS